MAGAFYLFVTISWLSKAESGVSVSPSHHDPAGFVVDHGGDHDGDVEQLVAVEGDVEASRPEPLRYLEGVDAGSEEVNGAHPEIEDEGLVDFVDLAVEAPGVEGGDDAEQAEAGKGGRAECVVVGLLERWHEGDGDGGHDNVNKESKK